MIKKMLIISLVSLSLNIIANDFEIAVAQQMAQTSSVEAIQTEAKTLCEKHWLNSCFGKLLMNYWYSEKKRCACRTLQLLSKGKLPLLNSADLKNYQEERMAQFKTVLPENTIKKMAQEELIFTTAATNLVKAKRSL